LGELDDEEKPRFSSLRKEQLIETITLEEALELVQTCREMSVNMKHFQ
jgi:DNA topoisomerase-1